MKKDYFLSLLEENKFEELSTFINTQGAGTKKVIEALNETELDNVWKFLKELLVQLREKFFPVHQTDGCTNGNEEKERERAHLVLKMVCVVANDTVQIPQGHIPEYMATCVRFMHGILLRLENKKIQNLGIQLCEIWWKRKLEYCESYCGNALTLLLRRTFQARGVKNDVKRVYQMRESLVAFRFDGDSNEELKRLLVQAARSTLYLSCPEGLNFIAYLFSLGPQFVQELHNNIKEILPSCKNTQAKDIGKIYYAAWINANRTIKSLIEEKCLRDLIHHAFYVQRKGNEMTQLGHNLVNVLSAIHLERNPAVENVLAQLYAPLIWRMLKSPSLGHRRNAADIFFGSFYPMCSPDAREELNYSYRLYKVMKELLIDNCHIVRIIATKGVLSVLNEWWQVIPGEIIKEIFQILVNQLSVDESSSEVRRQVFKGLKSLVNNIFAAPYLKEVLPHFHLSLYDGNLGVRIAFVDMLLEIKKTSEIKFWKVVPLENLILYLEIADPAVGKMVTELLFESFHPLVQPMNVILKRCIHLISDNHAAARQFYLFSKDCLDVPHAVEFMIAVLAFLKKSVKRECEKMSLQSDNENERPSRRCKLSKDAVSRGDKENYEPGTSSEHEKADEDEGESNGMDAAHVYQGLIDILCVLWTINAIELDKPENLKYFMILEVKVIKTVKLCLRFYKVREKPEFSSMMYLTSLLKPKQVEEIVTMCVSNLKSMPPDADDDKYLVYLSAMCHWKRNIELFEIITEWLDAAFRTQIPNFSLRAGRKRRVVKFRDIHEPKPILALRYLDTLLSHSTYRNIVFAKNLNELIEMWHGISHIKTLVEQRLENQAPLVSPLCSDKFLHLCLEWYCKLFALLHKNNEFNAVDEYTLLLDWAESAILPLLADEECETAITFLQIVYNIAVQMVIIGVTDAPFCVRLTKLAMKFLKSGAKQHFVFMAAKFAVNLCDYAQYYYGKQDSANIFKIAIPSLLKETLSVMALSVTSPDDLVKVGLKNDKCFYLDVLSTYEKVFGSSSSHLRHVVAIFLDCIILVMKHDNDQTKLGISVVKAEELSFIVGQISAIFLDHISLGHDLLTVLSMRLKQQYKEEEQSFFAGLRFLCMLIHNRGKLQMRDLKMCVGVVEDVIDQLPACSVSSELEASNNEENLARARKYLDVIKQELDNIASGGSK